MHSGRSQRKGTPSCTRAARSAREPRVALGQVATHRLLRLQPWLKQERPHPEGAGAFQSFWRPGSESNRRSRLCRPLHDHSATWPRRRALGGPSTRWKPGSLNDMTPACRGHACQTGAGNETRTRDPDLGKVVLYQLSYSRLGAAQFKTSGPHVKLWRRCSCSRSDAPALAFAPACWRSSCSRIVGAAAAGANGTGVKIAAVRAPGPRYFHVGGCALRTNAKARLRDRLQAASYWSRVAATMLRCNVKEWMDGGGLHQPDFR